MVFEFCVTKHWGIEPQGNLRINEKRLFVCIRVLSHFPVVIKELLSATISEVYIGSHFEPDHYPSCTTVVSE